MKEKIKAEITCPLCGYFEDVEYELEIGLNTLEWKCPDCDTVTTIVRKIEKEEKKNETTLPLFSKNKRDT